MKKLIWNILLMVVCTLLFAQGTVFAEQVSGDWIYELTPEGLVITGYSGAESDVVIPNEIDGNKVSVIGRQAFVDNHEMKTLVIPEGVVSIKAEAFFGCSGLSRIEFNAKNCTVPPVWIYSDDNGTGVFSGAGSSSPDGLTVVFGDKVAKIPDYLFDTASINEYGHNGYPSAAVTAVELSDSVKEIGICAFRNCQLLESVTFGAGVKTIDDDAFSGCIGLTSLAFDDALVSIGKRSFLGNTALESIAWGQGLESIDESAFSDCTSLMELSFVNPLTTIGVRAFSDCTALQILSLPDSLVNLCGEAFSGCIKLNQLDINCLNLAVPDVWIYASEKGAGVFSGAGSASPTGLTVTFGDKVTNVPVGLFDTASIGEYGKNGYPYAFVTEAVFSDSVKEIGARAFCNCQSLEQLSFGQGLITIGDSAFWGCTALPELVFNDALLSIEKSAFLGDTSLEQITWGGSLESIGEAAFRGCTSLTEFTPECPLTVIGNLAFADCTGIKSVELPESVVNLNADAFINCIKLEQLTINCQNLTVPEVWIYDPDKGTGVFSGAGSGSPTGLKVSFGDSVTKVPDYLFDTASLEEYGKNGYPYAFVTEVEIPKSVTEIGTYAFRSCQSLKTVRFYCMDAMFGDDVFAFCDAPDFHIECIPGGLVEWYVKNEGFSYTALEDSELPEEHEEGSGAESAAEAGEEPSAEAGEEPSAEVGEEPAAEAEEGDLAEDEETAESAAQDTDESDGTWTCSNGHSGNTGKFCPECGEPRPVNVCPNCGYEFPDDTQYKFCPECGQAL